MNTNKTLEILAKEFDSEKESIIVNYVGQNGDCSLLALGSVDDIRESLKSVIISSLSGETPENVRQTASAIISAVNEAIAEVIIGGKNVEGYEDCSKCEHADFCNEESARMFRKSKNFKPRKIDLN